MEDKVSNSDYDHPVAYDANGQPLYAHPPKAEVTNTSNAQPAQAAGTQVVHMSRPIEPVKPVISDATKLKHAESKRLYPHLNLSDGEYVISAVKRHPIGLILPIIVGVLLVSFALIVVMNYEFLSQFLQVNGQVISYSAVLPFAITFITFIAVATYITYFIYTSNRFFLTNESVIQEIQTGLFSKLEQTVSLSNIEDASFTQIGIIQQIFNYGSIRLSTEGDETTYRFSFVENPKEHIAILNNAVEAFQNGRPVDTN